MADEDKPFVCTEMDCGMRFTNEDHLSVHLKKHDMSLALNLSTALGGLSPMAVFTDQTPTPTKFLRNCEEIGLFQDLNKNPFDDSFKKAMDEPLDMENPAAETVHSIPIPGPGLNDLDTPQPPIPKVVIINDDEMEEIKTTGGENKKKDVSQTSIVPKKRKKFLTQSMATSTTSEDEDESVIDSSSADVEAATPPKVLSKGTNSPPAVSSSTEELKQKGVITSEAVVAGVESTPAPSSNPGPVMVQVFLQLPSGLTVPVEVPATTLTPSQQKSIMPQQIIQLPSVNPVPQAQVINVAKNVPHVVMPKAQFLHTVPTAMVNQISAEPAPVAANLPPHLRAFKLETSPLAQGAVGKVISQKAFGHSSVTVKTRVTPEKRTVVPTSPLVINPSPSSKTTHGGSHLYTKQRLKAALQQQTTPSSSQKISQIFQMVNEVKREPQMSPIPVDSSSFVSSSGSVSSPEDRAMLMGGMLFDSDDTDGRRKKFLERNRAAAARCRQKRKKWVTNLESKADELTNINVKLSTEIKAMRGEIAQLKTLLLAHKDCPVTLQQRSHGQITPQTYVIETSQDDSVLAENLEKSDIPKTVSTVPMNSDGLPNIITCSVNQSASSAVNASLVPSIIAFNQSSLQSTTPLVNGGMVPSIITLDQSNTQTLAQASVGGDLLPSIITIDQTKCETRPMGVITGPNSISMIPKIINMEQLLQMHDNQKS